MTQFIYAVSGGGLSVAAAWSMGGTGPLADGATGPADSTLSNRELLVQATIEPTNTLTLAKPKLNKNNGTATVKVTVPNAGALAFAGSGVKVTGPTTTTAAGEVTLKIKAKGKKRAALNDNGKVTVKPKLTFTPTNGVAATLTKKVKLKRD
jgi:hypothetical protein